MKNNDINFHFHYHQVTIVAGLVVFAIKNTAKKMLWQNKPRSVSEITIIFFNYGALFSNYFLELLLVGYDSFCVFLSV